MEQLEKVDRLRERADVSYEEAKEALEASGWDLLDAMVYLEKHGKVKGPGQETHSTSYDEQVQYVSVREKVQEQEEEPTEGLFTKIGKLCKLLLKMGWENYFCVDRKGKNILEVPVLVLVLAAMFVWQVVIPAVIIGLFFDCHYSFHGKDELENANKAMEKASEMANKVKDEFERM